VVVKRTLNYTPADRRTNATMFYLCVGPLVRDLIDLGMRPAEVAAELRDQDIETLAGTLFTSDDVLLVLRRHAVLKKSIIRIVR